MEDDEYACVSRGKLKLKNDSGVSKRKKKKDRDTSEKMIKAAETETKQTEPKTKQIESKMTPAEIAFKKMQEKMQKERISQKASMTHKQRVEKFNQHLDSLTEHFDIPKVSWTK